MNRIKLVLATVLSLAFAPVAAQDFAKGMAAYQSADFKTALEELKPLAERGNNEVQFLLGQFYVDYAIPMDLKEAVKWLKLSASQGNGGAQFKLCSHYDLGLGVLEDNVMAHMWCNIASANPKSSGDYSALSRNNKSIIVNEMTQADISKAQAMARECMNSGYTKCGW